MNDVVSNILEIINSAIKEALSKQLNESNCDDDLDKLGIDSLLLIQIIAVIEEVYDIKIPDEYLLISEINNINKIASVVSVELEKKFTRSD